MLHCFHLSHTQCTQQCVRGLYIAGGSAIKQHWWLIFPLPTRRDGGGGGGQEEKTEAERQRERDGQRVRERRESELETERQTEMGNEKDSAVIIIAEFAFRMQTDQGHGAWGRYQIPHKHTHAHGCAHTNTYICTHISHIYEDTHTHTQPLYISVLSLRSGMDGIIFTCFVCICVL